MNHRVSWFWCPMCDRKGYRRYPGGGVFPPRVRPTRLPPGAHVKHIYAKKLGEGPVPGMTWQEWHKARGMHHLPPFDWRKCKACEVKGYRVVGKGHRTGEREQVSAWHDKINTEMWAEWCNAVNEVKQEQGI